MSARGAFAAFLAAAVVLSVAGPADAGAVHGAAGPAWHTNYAGAAARATRTGRPLLLFFTGSDWCDWCRALRDEVFDTPEFADWARRAVVLVEVDFPRYARQNPARKRQNRRLAKRFADLVRGGYPTVVFLDPTGKRTLGDLGYVAGGPESWIEAADRILREAR